MADEKQPEQLHTSPSAYAEAKEHAVMLGDAPQDAQLSVPQDAQPAPEKPASTGDSKFLKGTLILTVSSIVVKVVGALNWILLSRVLGGEGIGLYQMGFPMYLMAITLSSAGIPVAISIITAEKLAQRDYQGAKRVFNVTLWLLLALGLLFSSGLYFGAQWLIDLRFIRDPRAYYSVVALAPAVFFVTFLASFRGYLQGWQIMTPTAVSEVTEQLVRVVTMLFFASYFMPQGLARAAGGASMGAGAGAFCALLVLMFFYHRLKQKFSAEFARQNLHAVQESARSIVTRLLKLALPVSMSSLMLPVVANLDLLIVPQRLEVAGFDVSHATELFGYLTGMAVPLVNLACIFTAALAISLVPAISEERTLRHEEGLRHKASTAFRVALIISFPCFAGLFTLGQDVAALIYNAPGAGPAIRTMSVGIVLLGLHQVSTAVLQGLGRTAIPVLNMIIAMLCKVVLSWTLTAMPTLGIRGSAVATVADFGIAAIINMWFIYRLTGYRLSPAGVFKPALASAVMGAAILLVQQVAHGLGGWTILLCMCVAPVVYALALMLLGGLTAEDLRNLPFVGRRMLALGQRFGFFKA